MKKPISILLIILVLGGGFFAFKAGILDLNSDAYYVKITTDGKVKEVKIVDGSIIKKYDYNFKAYNEKGTEIDVTFSAVKNLKKDRYLKISPKTTKDNEVNEIKTYEEVSKDKVPSKALSNLDK
ncbi:YxeA family protein [Clostridium chrysemydis]|uniref:YxeA family protein n=1 Tax=Clostridium chrysemydis TaxID=2665504 RepID=UPI0018838058|nr:YxeA family protein [Clostridium chrysemydis]